MKMSKSLPEDQEVLIKDDEQQGFSKPSSTSTNKHIFVIVFLLLVIGLSGVFLGLWVQRNSHLNNLSQEVSVVTDDSGDYYVGVGRYDVTGPIAQVNMMGYAYPDQTAHGLHLRLYARTFIVCDLQNTTSIVFVTVDSGMAAMAVKLEVVKKLRMKYGNLYTERNVVISGTHSHSGPAGFFQYLLFEVTSQGFIKQTTDSFVDGIVNSIDIAHRSLRRGRLSLATGEVPDANINRSPSAYEHNTEEERKKYKYNTEHGITGLQVEDASGKPIGLFTWYPVHGTSMNETNELISSDNRGRASALYEKYMRKMGEIPGRESFVAAFASANLGDVSPNTKGPICIDTGKPCDYEKSTCGFPPSVHNCIAFGPGKDMVESTDIIGTRQFNATKAIMENGTAAVRGKVGFAHQYVDMTKETVTLADGSKSTTCKPAMGYSFAAGTTDGPGAFDFHQSMTEGTPLWDSVRDIIAKVVCKVIPTQADYDCHKPKPVLLPTGFMDIPYAWHPSIVDVQLLRVGQLLIAAVPGEFTTMAGRRLKDAIKKRATSMGMPGNTRVVIAGLSNVYTHYITTFEEFGAQRYEGGSTIFGPHTHAAYVQRFEGLTEAVAVSKTVDPGPTPENLLDKQIELLPPPAVDTVPVGKNFGGIIVDAQAKYTPGETVKVKFYGANPRNNMRLNQTYLQVQKLCSDGSNWDIVVNDDVWETKLTWESKLEVNNTKPGRHLMDGLIDMVTSTTGMRIEIERLRSIFNPELQGESSEDSLYVKQQLEKLKPNNLEEISLMELIDLGVVSRVPPQLKSNKEELFDESYVTIEWTVPIDQTIGMYRIVYYGDELNEDKTLTPFTGTSRQFEIRLKKE